MEVFSDEGPKESTQRLGTVGKAGGGVTRMFGKKKDAQRGVNMEPLA